MSKKTIAVLRFPTIESSILLAEDGSVIAADQDEKFTIHQMGELIGGADVSKFWDSGVLSLSTALVHVYRAEEECDTTVIHAVYESKHETEEERENDENELFEDIEHDGGSTSTGSSTIENLVEETFSSLW